MCILGLFSVCMPLTANDDTTKLAANEETGANFTTIIFRCEKYKYGSVFVYVYMFVPTRLLFTMQRSHQQMNDTVVIGQHPVAADRPNYPQKETLVDKESTYVYFIT